MKQKSTLAALNDSVDGDKSSDLNNAHSIIDTIQKKIISELLVIVNTSSLSDTEIHVNNLSDIQNNDVETTETDGNNSADENNYEKDIDLKNILEKYFEELKSSLSSLSIPDVLGECNKSSQG